MSRQFNLSNFSSRVLNPLQTNSKAFQSRYSSLINSAQYIENEFVVAITQNLGFEVGISAINIKSFEVYVTQFIDNRSFSSTLTLLNTWKPMEVILPLNLSSSILKETVKIAVPEVHFTFLGRKLFDEVIGVEIFTKSTSQLSFTEFKSKYLVSASLGALINFFTTETNITLNADKMIIKYYFLDEFTFIDFFTVKQLEILFNNKNGRREFSLFSLFSPKTVGGQRLLRSSLLQPLCSVHRLRERQETVEYLRNKDFLRGELKKRVTSFKDFEVLVAKFVHSVSDESSDSYIKTKLLALICLVNRLENIPDLLEKTKNIKTLAIEHSERLITAVDLMKTEITRVLECPSKISREATLTCFKRGGDNILDTSLSMLTELEEEVGSHFISLRSADSSLEIAKNEGKEYNLSSLKQLDAETFIKVRKKGIRYFYLTRQLISLNNRIKELKITILDRSIELIKPLIDLVQANILDLYLVSDTVNKADLLICLSEQAKPHFCKPQFTEDKALIAKNSVHPVLEQNGEILVKNDLLLSSEFNSLVIRGVNASGKTTFLKQIVLNLILAQIGAFVPCESLQFEPFSTIYCKFETSDLKNDLQSSTEGELESLQRAAYLEGKHCLAVLDEPLASCSSKYSKAVLEVFMRKFKDSPKKKLLVATHSDFLFQLSFSMFNVLSGSVVSHFEEDKLIFTHKLRIHNPSHDPAEQKNKEALALIKLVGFNNEFVKVLF